MAGPGPKKPLAVDTNLLLALAEDHDYVTSDQHLLDINEDTLLFLFHEADLLPVRIAHPRRLLRALG